MDHHSPWCAPNSRTLNTHPVSPLQGCLTGMVPPGLVVGSSPFILGKLIHIQV